MDDFTLLDIFEFPCISAKTSRKQERHRKSKSKGGYRPVLVDKDTLEHESCLIQGKINDLKRKFDRNELSKQDSTSNYILLYIQMRYPNKFLENYDPIVHKNEYTVKSTDILEHFLIEENSNLCKRLVETNTKTFFDVINNFNLHSIPRRARVSLVKWYTGEYKLELIFHVAAVDEMVEYQSQGRRCISLITQNLGKLVENARDPLSFLLHDLVHSYKMFNNIEIFKGQVGFSIAMRRILNYKKLKDFFGDDENYCEDLNYIMSDMNSHTKHLMFCFKTCLIRAFKRRHGLCDSNQLKHISLIEFNETFEEIIELFEMNEQEKQSARDVLNCGDFKTFNFLILNEFFIRLYEQNKI